LCYRKTYASSVIPIHMFTYSERLTKISLAVAEIFGPICRFLLSRTTRCSCYPHNLWGYWTKCHQNCIQCKEIHSIWDFEITIVILQRFGMAVPQRRLADFSTLIGYHGNVPLQIWKLGIDPLSTLKVLSYVKRLRKSVQYIWRYPTKYAEPRREHAMLFWLASSPPKLLDRSSPNFYTI